MVSSPLSRPNARLVGHRPPSCPLVLAALSINKGMDTFHADWWREHGGIGQVKRKEKERGGNERGRLFSEKIAWSGSG